MSKPATRKIGEWIISFLPRNRQARYWAWRYPVSMRLYAIRGLRGSNSSSDLQSAKHMIDACHQRNNADTTKMISKLEMEIIFDGNFLDIVLNNAANPAAPNCIAVATISRAEMKAWLDKEPD
jgi:hypothetical protein